MPPGQLPSIIDAMDISRLLHHENDVPREALASVARTMASTRGNTGNYNPMFAILVGQSVHKPEILALLRNEHQYRITMDNGLKGAEQPLRQHRPDNWQQHRVMAQHPGGIQRMPGKPPKNLVGKPKRTRRYSFRRRPTPTDIDRGTQYQTHRPRAMRASADLHKAQFVTRSPMTSGRCLIPGPPLVAEFPPPPLLSARPPPALGPRSHHVLAPIPRLSNVVPVVPSGNLKDLMLGHIPLREGYM